jgi:hypothetical protein
MFNNFANKWKNNTIFYSDSKKNLLPAHVWFIIDSIFSFFSVGSKEVGQNIKQL